MFSTLFMMFTSLAFWLPFALMLVLFNYLGLFTFEFAKQIRKAAWWRQHYVMVILLVATTLAVIALYLYLLEIGSSLVVLVDRLKIALAEPSSSPEDLRHLGTTVALLMGVLAASATILFSIIRVWINERTASATEQALFNDKINAAFTDLHAQRQVTKWELEGQPTGWDDDVTRRNGAIDRLQGLASEEPEAAPRIARMLSVYVKELTREFPAETPPNSIDPEKLREWENKLRVKRSDMQNAVQVLGRLRKASGADLDDGEINLIGVNLQGFALSHLNFEKVSFKGAELQGADLLYTELQGANLIHTKLQGADLTYAKLQGTSLIHAELQGADLGGAGFDHTTTLSGALTTCAALSEVDLEKTTITSEQLNAMFGDASVTLPDGKGPDDPEWPEHWSKEELDPEEFQKQWRAFQRERGFDPNNPA